MSYNPVFTSGFKVMNGEYATQGKCGVAVNGLCNKDRFCNQAGECGPEQTHKDGSSNNQYRFCRKYNDIDCKSFSDKLIDGRFMTHDTKDNYYIYGLKRMACPKSFD